jgi:hypothetical protein
MKSLITTALVLLTCFSAAAEAKPEALAKFVKPTMSFGPPETRTYTIMDNGQVFLDIDGYVGNSATPLKISGHFVKRLTKKSLQDVQIMAILLDRVQLEKVNVKDCVDSELSEPIIPSEYYVVNHGKETKVAEMGYCQQQIPADEHLRNASENLRIKFDVIISKLGK